MRALYFFPMNLSVKSESPSLPSAKGTEQKQGYIGGVACLLGDGSARFVSDNILLSTWQALGTRAGDEPASDF